MTLLLYAEVNIVCVILLGIMAAKSLFSSYSGTVKDKAFTASLWFVMFWSVFDVLERLAENLPPVKSIPLLYGLNLLYFICFDAAAFCWFCYAEIIQNKKILKNKKRRVAFAVPLAALVVLLLASCFTGWVFYVDAGGVYHRGPLFFAQAAVVYGYVFATIVQGFYRANRQTYFASKNELITISICSVAIMACGLLQLFIPNFPLLIAGVTVSVLIKFTNSLKLMILLDPLTGIPNRRELLTTLAAEMKAVKPGQELYFLFIDVDCFKQINDSCGHTEGDRILSKVSAAIKDFCEETHGYCARYGGDEFAVIIVLNRESNIEAVCSALKRFVQQRGISTSQNNPVQVSVGHTKYRGEGDTVQSIIARADIAMYKAKEQNKMSL